MLIANGGLGELVMEAEARAGRVGLEADGDARRAGRDRVAAGVAVGEDDALGRDNLEDFADGLDAVGVADVDFAAGDGIDGGAGAPPTGPFRALLEKAEDGFGGGLNENGAVERVR